jgi:hypothetical protein
MLKWGNTEVKNVVYKGQHVASLKFGNDQAWTAIDPPTGFTATSMDHDSIQLSWDAVEDAVSYRVYYGTTSSASDGTADFATNTGQIHGLSPYTKYYFYIRAKNQHVFSTTTGTIDGEEYTTPTAVTNVNVQTYDKDSLYVTWTASPTASKYHVYYKLTTSNTWIQASPSPTNTNKHIHGLGENAYYSIRVVAVADSGDQTQESASSYGSGSTGANLANPALSLTSANDSTININWGPITGASAYEVYYSTGSGSYSKVADTTSTNYSFTSKQIGTLYNFKVRAKYIYTDGANDPSSARTHTYSVFSNIIRNGKLLPPTGGSIATDSSTNDPYIYNRATLQGVTRATSATNQIRVQFSHHSNFSSVYNKYSSSVTNASIATTDLGSFTTSYVRFRAEDTTGVWTASDYRELSSFVIQPSISTPPVVTIPSAGQNSIQVQFTRVPFQKYTEIQVSTSSSFSTILHTVLNTSTTATGVQITGLEPNTTYYARAKALVVDGTTIKEDFSSLYSARASSTTPRLDTPVFQNALSTGGDTTPTFTWNSVFMATHYQVAWGGVTYGLQTSRSFTVPTMSATGSFGIVVRAYRSNNGSTSEWSPPHFYNLVSGPRHTISNISHDGFRVNWSTGSPFNAIELLVYEGTTLRFTDDSITSLNSYKVFSTDLYSWVKPSTEYKIYTRGLELDSNSQIPSGYTSLWWLVTRTTDDLPLATPSLGAPAGHFVDGDTVSFLWQDIDNADAYEFELTEPNNTVTVYNPSLASLTTNGLADGDYSARVRAKNTTHNVVSDWSATVNFHVHSQATGSVDAPAFDTIEVSYQTDSNYDETEIVIKEGTSSYKSTKETVRVANNSGTFTFRHSEYDWIDDSLRYYGYARGVNLNNGSINESQSGTLYYLGNDVTPSLSLGTPTITVPTEIEETATATIEWSPVSNATEYDLYITPPTGSSFFHRTSSLQYELTDPLVGDYQFQVRASNDAFGRSGSYSTTKTLTVNSVNFVKYLGESDYGAGTFSSTYYQRAKTIDLEDVVHISGCNHGTVFTLADGTAKFAGLDTGCNLGYGITPYSQMIEENPPVRNDLRTVPPIPGAIKFFQMFDLKREAFTGIGPQVMYGVSTGGAVYVRGQGGNYGVGGRSFSDGAKHILDTLSPHLYTYAPEQLWFPLLTQDEEPLTGIVGVAGFCTFLDNNGDVWMLQDCSRTSINGTYGYLVYEGYEQPSGLDHPNGYPDLTNNFGNVFYNGANLMRKLSCFNGNVKSVAVASDNIYFSSLGYAFVRTDGTACVMGDNRNWSLGIPGSSRHHKQMTLKEIPFPESIVKVCNSGNGFLFLTSTGQIYASDTQSSSYVEREVLGYYKVPGYIDDTATGDLISFTNDPIVDMVGQPEVNTTYGGVMLKTQSGRIVFYDYLAELSGNIDTKPFYGEPRAVFSDPDFTIPADGGMALISRGAFWWSTENLNKC